MSTLSEYLNLRQARLDLQKQVDVMDQKEKQLKADLVDQLRAAGIVKMTETHGDLTVGVKMTKTEEPNVENWSELIQHIKETGEIDLLQKRVTASAVKQRWEEGKSIPGVSPVDKYDIKPL